MSDELDLQERRELMQLKEKSKTNKRRSPRITKKSSVVDLKKIGFERIRPDIIIKSEKLSVPRISPFQSNLQINMNSYDTNEQSKNDLFFIKTISEKNSFRKSIKSKFDDSLKSSRINESKYKKKPLKIHQIQLNHKWKISDPVFNNNSSKSTSFESFWKKIIFFSKLPINNSIKINSNQKFN